MLRVTNVCPNECRRGRVQILDPSLIPIALCDRNSSCSILNPWVNSFVFPVWEFKRMPPSADMTKHSLPYQPLDIGELDLGLPRAGSKRGSHFWVRIVLSAVLATSILLAFLFVDKHKLKYVAEWLETHRSGSAMLVFLFLCIIAVVFIIPGPVLAIIAGALYGKFLGAAIVWSAGTIGQSLTYFLGRFLLRDLVVHFASKHISKFQIIDTVLAREGWKLVLLLRLSPILPDSLLNYVLSVTSISYCPYAISSSIAILPWTIAFSYLGSLAHNVAEAAGGDLQWSSTAVTCWSIISVVVLLILGWYTARISKQALAEALDDKNRVESYRI